MAEFENRKPVDNPSTRENPSGFILSGEEIKTTFGDKLKAVFSTLLATEPGSQDRGVFASWWLPQIEKREEEERYRTTGEREIRLSLIKRLKLAWQSGITME